MVSEGSDQDKRQVRIEVKTKNPRGLKNNKDLSPLPSENVTVDGAAARRHILTILGIQGAVYSEFGNIIALGNVPIDYFTEIGQIADQVVRRFPDETIIIEVQKDGSREMEEFEHDPEQKPPQMRPTPDTLKRQLRWLNEIDKALQDRPWNAALRREIQKTLEDNVLLPDDFDQMTEDAIREYLSASTTRILDELEDAPVE